MGFEEFLPEEKEGESEISFGDRIVSPDEEKFTPNQVFDVITSKKPDWQVIIYESIHSERLDPWDVDVVVLTRKYFQKVLELEEDPDFYASSKVLLAAALLLRIKSEFLLNKHIKSIDEILFGKKESEKPSFERIEIDEDELPVLIPKTPLSRHRKVTLNELMFALNKAMNTETRRIKREVAIKRAHKLSHVDIPKFRRVDLKDRIKQFYARILTALKKPEKSLERVSYSKLVGKEKEEKLACFLPVLHLSNTRKLWLEQEEHLDEIWIYLYSYFEKNRDRFMEELEEDIDEMKEELEHAENVEGEKVNGLEKARRKLEEKKRLEFEVKNELMKELGVEISKIEEEENIEKVSGFGDEV